MALPVVIVAAGGLPMTRLSVHGGLPVTLAAQGLAVTEAPSSGVAMTFVTEAGSIVLPGPGPSPPTILTGVIGWWDASVTSSLNLTGSSINSIADQSGGNNTMNWIGNAKPVYNATGFNGKPAIINDGSVAGSGFACTNFPMGTGNTLTIWFVGQHTGFTGFGSDDGRLLSYIAPGDSLDSFSVTSWVLARGQSTNTAVQISRNTTGGNFACTITSPFRVIVTINSSGVQTAYVNGVATTKGTMPGNWATGGTLRFGALPQPIAVSYWDGPMAEAGVATGYSDATVVATLDNQLKTKWGM